MVTGSLPARSPRRAAGLALTAGAVLVLTGGAYADGASHHAAPEVRPDASTLRMRPVAHMAAWEAPGTPVILDGGGQAPVARADHRQAGTAQETRAARDVRAVTPSAEASGAAAGEPPAAPSTGPSTVPSAGPSAGASPSAAGLPGPTAGPPARLSAPPLILPALPPLPSLPSEGGRHAASRSDGPTEPAAQGAGSSASPSGKKSPLAGRQAGEGRVRPGRSLSPMELARSEATPEQDEPETDAGEMPVIASPPGASPAAERSAPPRSGRQALDGPAVRHVRQVSLGAGIALVGLGLGFLGLRMRRTN